MASPLSDAIMQSMVSSMDPMNGIIRQMATQSVATQEITLATQQGQAITEISSMLKAAKEDEAPASVINAYEKLLAKLTK